MSASSRPALALLVALTATGALGCEAVPHPRQLDHDLIVVTSAEARLRIDTVGVGQFTSVASFVLVDAENRARDGAMVTLGGSLRDAAGAVVGNLKPESLWIPAGERRTFALVDDARVPRASAVGAQLKVRGAMVPLEPPIMHVSDLHSFDDYGKTVLQAALTNDVDRSGTAMVLAAFYDHDDRPMTRPFTLMPIGPKVTRTVRFVGPQGSVRGTIFLGDLIY
jgi:hypothetical protein